MSSTSHTIDEVARVYARSIFELADQAGGQEKILSIGDELEAIAEMVRSDHALREFFRSPIIDLKRRRETLRKVFDGQISDLVLRFILVLNDKGRLSRIGDITDAFDQIANERFGRIEVDVFTTTGSLEAQQLESLSERIKARLGKDPIFHQYTDESMIGGVSLRIGDQLIDGSVRGRLRRLREGLHNRGTEVVREQPDRFMSESEPDRFKSE